jgi:autotransporter-associated beta strand protein
LDAALKGLFGTARQRYSATKGAAYYEVILRQLTAGHQYQIQAWVNDSRSTSPLGRTSIVKDMEGGAQSAEIKHNSNVSSALGGVGQVITGSFVASDTNQIFRFIGEKTGTGSGSYCAFISAFQVRDMTPMYWTATAGNWNTTGLNWDPAADADIVWSLLAGPTTVACFTNNATATLASDVWALDVNVYSNTTIKRPASTATTTLTTMRNLSVDANRTLTIGDGVDRRQTAIVVSNTVSGAGAVDVKAFSRIVLGKNAVGTVNASISGDGGNYKGGIQSVNYGNAEWSGPITTAGSVAVPARVGAGINGVLTISGKISGNTLGIRSEASVAPIGVVKLTHAGNNYTNDTTLYTPLRLGCNNAIPVASKWAFNAAVANGNPSVDLNGYNQEVQDFTGTAAGSNITNSSVTASVLTVSNSVSQTASVLRVTGNLSVVKRGTATLTLGATNTYSGTTTIEEGTLALSASGEIPLTERVILSGGALDLSDKTGYTFARPLQVTTNSSVVGTLTMGTTTELAFDGTSVALAGGTITMAGQTLRLTTTATLVEGTDYPLISGYTTGTLPALDSIGLTVPDGATASLVLAGGTLSLSVVTATTDTTTTLATVPAEMGTYGDSIVLTATVFPVEVPAETTVNLYAASDLNTVIQSGVVSAGQVQFTVVKPEAGSYSYVAKYMGGGIYRPSQSAATSSVTIQPKMLTISDIQLNKLFDGTTNVAPRFVTTGVVAGEPNPVTCVGYYADAAPGALKPVALVWNMVNLNYDLTGNSATGEGAIFEHALWTGGASDGLWHTPGNWDQGIVPNNSGVAALFNTDTTVVLASGVNIKKLTFNASVTLNGPGTFTFPTQYSTGEVAVASSKTVTFNALVNSAWEGIPKTGLGTLVLVGDHRFGGKLDVREGVAEINQTVAGALMYRNYSIAESATLRFVCAGIGSAGTQLTGTQWVTGDGTFEVVSGYLRIQSDVNKVNMAMSEKGQIIVRNGAKMDNSNAGGNRFATNKAKLVVEPTGYFGLYADSVRFGSLHGDGEIKADWNSQTLTITGDSDGAFSGLLTQKDAANKLSLTKAGPGTQILSGTNTYTGTTTIMGGRLTLEGGDNRLSFSTQVLVTNAVLNLGLTQQTLNNNPDFRSESKLALDVSKTSIGRLTLTNSIDVSGWKVTINNPSVYPKGKRFAVISTGADKIITGAPALVDMPSGFIIYNQDNTIYVDSPAMIIFFK